MRRLFAPVADEIGFVCENGALVYYKDQLLFERDFDQALAREIMEDIENRDNAEISYSTKDFYYIKPKTEEFFTMMTRIIKNDCRSVNSLDEMILPCIKMAVYEVGGTKEGSYQYWYEHSERCKVVTSGLDWVDFIPFDVNKALGLRRLMDFLKIRPEECMAFGDEYNDVEMLQCVPYGFAMAHAKAGVREKAAYEAKSVEEILRRLLAADGEIEEVLKNVQ
jgi:Cof subfamily protein (haloacid dehalogenase superfamily)